MLSSSTSHSGRIASLNGMEAIVPHLATSVAMGTWQIHSYFKDLRISDRNVIAFVNDLESMAVACEAVGKLVTEHSEQREEQMQQLWGCLEARLRACNNTVSQLELAIDAAKQGVKKDKTALGRMIRQIRRDGSSKETEEARCQIQAHAISLQVIIHTARIQFIYLSPGNSDPSMCTELSLLKSKKHELQKLRAHRSSKQFDPLNKNETEILWMSDSIVFSGETLYAANISGSSQRADNAPCKANYTQAWIGSITCDPPTPETDTPSIFSHPRSRGLSNPLTPETDTPSVFSYALSPRASTVEDVIDDKGSKVQQLASPTQMADMESEEELEIEAETIQRLIASGRSFFERGELEPASSHLYEAQKMVFELPGQLGDALNLFELLYMIGFCTFYLEEPSSTVSALEHAIEQHRKSEHPSHSDKLQIAEMSHMLAQTFVKLQDLEKARTSCQEALKARRKLLGKTHELYLVSLELMASIWEAEGNPIRAQVYKDMLIEGQGSHRGTPVTCSPLSHQAIEPERNSVTGPLLQSITLEKALAVEDAQANYPKPLTVKRKPISKHLPQVSEVDHDTFKEVSPTSARITDVAFGPLDHDVAKQDRADYPYPFKFTDSVPTSSTHANQNVLGHSKSSIRESNGMSQIRPLMDHAKAHELVRERLVADNREQTLTPAQNRSAHAPHVATPRINMPAQRDLTRASSYIELVPPTTSSKSSKVACNTPESPTIPFSNDQVQATEITQCRNLGLTIQSEITPAHSFGPADHDLRRLWTLFFNIVPKKELSQTLLENRRQDALNLIPDGYQKKKSWSSKLLKSKGSSPIERRDLQLAALFGDAEIVDKLLSSGTDLAYNRNDLEGFSALHCAAIGGNYQITANLIAAHQPVEIVLDKYGTPLSLAVLGERTDLANLLLTHTLNPHVKCGNLGSVMHAACMTGNATLVGHLSQKLGKNALEASAIVYPSVVRNLRSMIVARSLSDLPDEAMLVHGSSERLEHMDARPLAVAAYLGCEAVVEYLLSQKNVDINAKCGAWSAPNMDDPKGSNEHTALTMAAAGGHDGIIRMLLDKGAILTPRKFEREDTLLLAVLNDHTTCALLLLERGAPVSSTSFREATNRSMLPLVTKMRSKRAGLHSSKLSTFSNDKSGIVVSADSTSEAFS